MPDPQGTDSGSPTERTAPSTALARWLAQKPSEDSWTVYTSHLFTLNQNQGASSTTHSTASIRAGGDNTITSSASSSKGLHFQDRSQWYVDIVGRNTIDTELTR